MKKTSDCCEDNYPWPGLRLACIKVLQLYCRVFERNDFEELARLANFSFYILLIKVSVVKITILLLLFLFVMI